MEKSRLALRRDKLAELKEIDNDRGAELAILAEQLRKIEETQER